MVTSSPEEEQLRETDDPTVTNLSGLTAALADGATAKKGENYIR